MYGLPKDFDASPFIGRRLESILFAENLIGLDFGAKVQITVFSVLSRQRRPDLPAEMIEVPVLRSDLMELLGHSISEASGTTNGTLTLKFDNGHVLQCLDDLPCYESYSIRVGEHEIIV